MLHAEMRPYSFSGVLGQDKNIKILQNDVLKDNVKGAYLFTGVRGTGKTTSARIMSLAVNCEHPHEDGSPCLECASCKSILNGSSFDVVELDAASHNSVDDIRKILEKVNYKPLSKRKVFIIDECHMLSNAASNALLKVLEEPPKDVIFILCTTEVHKVLATIKSRCSAFVFERIDASVILQRLQEVCNIKGVEAEKNALALIAKASDGAMRDGLSILDQFISMGSVTADVVATTLGMTPSQTTFDILNGVAKGEPALVVNAVRSLFGNSVSYVVEDIYSTLMDVIDFQMNGDPDSIVGSSDYVKEVMDLSYILPENKAFTILSELRTVFRADERALLSTLLSIIYSESKLVYLENKVDMLESMVFELQKNGVSPAASFEATSEEDESPQPEELVCVPVCNDNSPEEPEEPEGPENTTETQSVDEPKVESQPILPASDIVAPTESKDDFLAFDDFPDGMSFDEMAEKLCGLSMMSSDEAQASAPSVEEAQTPSNGQKPSDTSDTSEEQEAFTGPAIGFGDDLARLFR